MFNPDIGFCVAWLNVHILIFHFSGITWHTYHTQFIWPAHWYMKNYNTTGIMITQVKYNACTFIPPHWVFLTLVIYMKFIRLLFWNKCLKVIQAVLPTDCDLFLLCWFYHFVSVFEYVFVWNCYEVTCVFGRWYILIMKLIVLWTYFELCFEGNFMPNAYKALHEKG